MTLGHDRNDISISNMPIYRAEENGEWKLDHFEKTPIMPTYLLAFVVCDFEKKTETSKRGTKVSDSYFTTTMTILSNLSDCEEK